MIKPVTQFKSIIQGVENIFHFDSTCPTHIAKEALFECLKWIGQIEDSNKASQEQAPSSEEEHPKVEDLPQEVENVD